MIQEAKLLFQLDDRTYRRGYVKLSYCNGRIEFRESPYEMKNEIKAMADSKWQPNENGRGGMWTVADCPRNRFQLAYMAGENVYGHFEQPLREHVYARPLMSHQREMADHFLTYHYGVMAAEMGTGKTLALQEIIEKSGVPNWWWVGPAKAIIQTEREFKNWKLSPDVNVDMMSYQKLVKRMKTWSTHDDVPHGIVFDEASKIKNHVTDMAQAAQQIADLIRAKYGLNGYAILASGTPSPATPADWWSLCEIAWPGFLKEGSERALRNRLAVMEKKEFVQGIQTSHIVTWRDNEAKCHYCGDFEEAPQHEEDHSFQPSQNEVAYLHKRLRGLVVVKHKKDVLKDLPEKRYRKVYCEPSPSLLRAAKAIVGSAASAITAFTSLRELSDGFQYRDTVRGTQKCTLCTDGVIDEFFHPSDPGHVFTQLDLLDPGFVGSLVSRSITCPACAGSGHMPRIVRETVELPCPKDQALKDLLDENEECGRIVIFSGFTGSVDRISKLCQKKKWAVVRCDGRGLIVIDQSGKILNGVAALEYWADMGANPRVAWNAHPESGGMGFTLIEARMAVFYSNSYKPEFRTQAEDRIHRPGMDLNRGCTIVDLLHLPSDEKALDTVKANRRLELMTMGDLQQCYALAA